MAENPSIPVRDPPTSGGKRREMGVAVRDRDGDGDETTRTVRPVVAGFL